MTKHHGTAADEAYQARLRREAKERGLRRRENLATVMSTPNGRAFIYDLLYGPAEEGGLELESGYPANDWGIYRHMGRQDAGRALKAQITEQQPAAWELAVVEHIREAHARLRARRSLEAASEPVSEESDRDRDQPAPRGE